MREVLKRVLKRVLGEKAVGLLRRVRDTPFQLRHMYMVRYQRFLLKVLRASWNRPNLPKGVKSRHRSGCRTGGYNGISVGAHKYMPRREKRHILGITEKWCDGNPEAGPTNSEHNLWGSLEAFDLATHDRFHFDEYYHTHNCPGDEALLARCIESQPDLLVLTWLPYSAHNRKPLNPKLHTLDLIQRKLLIPIVAIWFDSVWPHIMDLAELILPLVEFNVVLDSTTAYLQRTKHPEKYLPMWTPQDPQIFYDGNMDRDIGISFIGSVDSYSDRCAGIAALRLNGIEVYQTGGQRERPLLPDQYARTYMRTKIALSFSQTRGYPAYTQTKGRIFEATLCGAMLLDAENTETSSWFEPMVDYVPFTDEADLVGKARYYLEHDVERMEIASRGYQKAQERYTGERFWRIIFSKVFDTSP